jgi:F-box/WD-40 domain protein MET30
MEDLAALSPTVQHLIQSFWTTYQQIPQKHRNLALDGMLHYSCFPQLSFLASTLDTLTKLDFLARLPNEVSYRILNYLDATSLCHSSQVSRKWKEICDNDVIWKRMCMQHIDKKCSKCGWGLPMLSALKRKQALAEQEESCSKRQKTATDCVKIQPLKGLPVTDPTPKVVSRPWKHIYAERLVVARNWKKSRFSSRNLIGHTDAIMSLFFDEAQSLLITASSDQTLRAWNTDTGVCVAILKGHTDVVRDVQFDDSKIVSCSMDKTIRIWNRRTFECVRVIEGIWI